MNPLNYTELLFKFLSEKEAKLAHLTSLLQLDEQARNSDFLDKLAIDFTTSSSINENKTTIFQLAAQQDITIFSYLFNYVVNLADIPDKDKQTVYNQAIKKVVKIDNKEVFDYLLSYKNFLYTQQDHLLNLSLQKNNVDVAGKLFAKVNLVNHLFITAILHAPANIIYHYVSNLLLYGAAPDIPNFDYSTRHLISYKTVTLADIITGSSKQQLLNLLICVRKLDEALTQYQAKNDLKFARIISKTIEIDEKFLVAYLKLKVEDMAMRSTLVQAHEDLAQADISQITQASNIEQQHQTPDDFILAIIKHYTFLAQARANPDAVQKQNYANFQNDVVLHLRMAYHCAENKLFQTQDELNRFTDQPLMKSLIDGADYQISLELMQSDNAQKEQSQNNVISLVNTSNNFFKSANAKIKPEIHANNLSLDNDEQGSSSALTQ